MNPDDLEIRTLGGEAPFGHLRPKDIGSGRAGALAALRHPAFRGLWLASLVSSTGTWMQNLTVPFIVYSLTDSTLWLSATVAAAFVPPFIASPFSGALSDRHTPRAVLLTALSTQMVAALCLAGLWQFGVHEIAPILVLVLLFSTGAGFHVVAWQTVIPAVVPRHLVADAVRLNSIQNMVARALGPALAGLVLSGLGPGAAFTGTALSFVGVVIVLVRLDMPLLKGAPLRTSMFSDLKSGWGYARSRPVPRKAIGTIACFYSTAYAVVQLAPVVAVELLDVGEEGYASLLVGHGAGALISALFITVAGDRVARSAFISAGLVGGSLGTVALAFATGIPVGLACFVVIGFGQTLLHVSQNTALILQTEAAFRGRVIALYLMATIGAVPLGNAVLGALATEIELRSVVLGAGLILALYTVIASLRHGGFRGFDAGAPSGARVDN